jgi:hypothetical protein
MPCNNFGSTDILLTNEVYVQTIDYAKIVKYAEPVGFNSIQITSFFGGGGEENWEVGIYPIITGGTI